MPADAFIQCRVSKETKALIRDLAGQENLSESALMRNLIEALFRTAQAPIADPSHAPSKAYRSERLYVRIAEQDRDLLGNRASDRSLAPATYVAVLVRAHLRSLTPLPKEELLALKELTGELGAIGRNLNQIARAANGSGAGAVGSQQIVSLLRLASGLRNHVKSLLLANERSWQTGHAQDKT
jgi:mobilization protein MobC